MLAGLVPTYLSFADFGMSLASTRFGAESFELNDSAREVSVIRSAIVIVLAFSIPLALITILSATKLSLWLGVPHELLPEAVGAIRIYACVLVITLLNGVLNTPQLSRLRMDMNSIVTVVPRILGTIALTLIVVLGGGLVIASLAVLIFAIVTLVGHVYCSRRLLPGMSFGWVDLSVARLMFRFGGSLVLSGIAAILLVNLEKIVLVRTTSVAEFASYSLAFTVANMATIFTQSLIQSLIPALSRLSTPGREGELRNLFVQSLRLVTVIVLPTICSLFVLSSPIFWYIGGEFGQDSVWAFRTLLIGLSFNLLGFAPYSLVVASGRVRALAKLYWIELIPYVILVGILTSLFGLIGAASAWSLRVFADSIALTAISIQSVQLAGSNALRELGRALVSALFLVPVVVLSLFIGNRPYLITFALLISIAVYSFHSWRNALSETERIWLAGRFLKTLQRS